MLTEVYVRCRQWKLPSMPSHERKLYNPDDSENDLSRDIRATAMDGRRSMSSEVGVQRIWKQFRRFLLFLCFLLFSALLFSSSLLWISARYKWCRHGFLPPANGGGVSLCAGSAERSPLSCTDWLWDLWTHKIAYVEWLFHSLFPFLLFSYMLALAVQEVCT